MPPAYYVLLHPDTKLSAQYKNDLIQDLQATTRATTEIPSGNKEPVRFRRTQADRDFPTSLSADEERRL